PRARAQSRDPLDAGGCQRPPQVLHPRPRPGHVLRAQEDLPADQGRGPRRRLRDAARQGRRAPGGRQPELLRLGPDGPLLHAGRRRTPSCPARSASRPRCGSWPPISGAAAASYALAGIFAIADWVAVWFDIRRLEYVAKPAFMVFLIIAVLFVHPFDGVVRWWFAAALLFGLLGDVALMLPRERWFLPGTIVFLVGHLAYIGGFLRVGARLPYAFAGAVVALVLVAAVGPSIIRALRSQKSPLLVPVVAYMLVFAVMLALAFGTTRKLIIAGALLF